MSKRLMTVIHTIVNKFCEVLWAYGLTGFNWAESAGLLHDLLTSGENKVPVFSLPFSVCVCVCHHFSVSETVCGDVFSFL